MIAPGRQSSSESSPYVLDPDSAAPLYHQIRESLRGAIEDSLLESGQMPPSERELALTYGVNRLTLGQAMGELVHEGLLRRAAVWRLQRLRFTDDEPFMIETVYLAHERFPDLDEADVVRDGLCRTLRERFGCDPADAEDTLEPVLLDAYERDLLQTDDKTLGLLVEATTRDTQGDVIEFSKSVVRGDRSRYVFRSHSVLTDQTTTASDLAAGNG